MDKSLPKMRYLLLLLFLLGVSFLSAQSIEQLKKDLAKAKTSKEKMLLNYQLADTYFKASSMRKKERFENAETYAKEAHRLAGQTGNNGMTAQSAYLLAKTYNNLKTVGEKSKRSRYSKNVDVWLKNAAASAELVGDYDLILNVYQERANLYTSGKDKNYRKAFQVMEEGLGVLTKNGKSISQLRNNYDRTEVKLSGNLQELRDEIRKLESEKGQLEKRNVNLTESNKEAKREISQKETVIRKKDEVILAKEDSLELAEQKAEEIEERAEEIREKLGNVSEENIYLKAAEEEARADVEQARADAAEKELKVQAVEQQRTYLGIGTGIILLLAIVFYARYISKKRANHTLQEEQERSEKLLLNILPKNIAEELKHKGRTTAKKLENVTVFFSDFKNFTKIAEQLTPEQLVEELDKCFKKFDFIIQKYPDIEKIKTIGDAYMCASGLNGQSRYPFNLIRASMEMQQALEELKQENIRQGKPYFEARIGIHTGPVVAGVVGTTKFAYDIWGDTVNVAARMESKGEIGRVNISESTYRLVKYKFECEYRGKVDAKNKGLIDMYFVNKELAGTRLPKEAATV